MGILRMRVLRVSTTTTAVAAAKAAAAKIQFDLSTISSLFLAILTCLNFFESF